jgi:hypothetical protein
MRTVIDLVGYESVKALNVYGALLIGGKNIPPYVDMPFPDYFEAIRTLPPADQENFFRVCVAVVPLEREEVEAITCFCLDANGVPYTRMQLKSMPLKDVFDIIISVCLEVAKFKIDFVSETEKKN